ncbi:glycine betaine ABC transporter substrate-binding protein OsmF [Chromobacterium violaceum]|uniref:ABC transporter substrate-binding protein n=1 Tax=Chromobacterium violaceum TaxID=536 RepID=A0A202BET7_CHRVL|nr:ABC transporter substrate-binding protein [Chromobacterium violaceum]OVE50036.1 ABC transporter substrate-binding protein [Chromobacterium violaceum]
MSNRMSRIAALLAGILTAATACAADAVRVGSKIDTEGALLGNLIQQVLEAHGVKTEGRLSLGNTKVVRTAIAAGEIDIYPEYTGNGAFFFSDEKNPAWKSAAAGYQRVKQLDYDKNRIVWLAPAPANNTWTIAVRRDVADANRLRTLADLGAWLGRGGRFKLAASAEFIEQPDALPAFQNAYGFKLRQDQLLALAGGDTSATVKAAAEQTSGVNAAMAYGTDGPVAALGLVALADPKGVQPVYAPTPIIRADALARHPDIAVWLKPVFQSLDAATLQKLNASIALEGRNARQVAAGYLKRKGFIQ